MAGYESSAHQVANQVVQEVKLVTNQHIKGGQSRPTDFVSIDGAKHKLASKVMNRVIYESKKLMFERQSRLNDIVIQDTSSRTLAKEVINKVLLRSHKQISEVESKIREMMERCESQTDHLPGRISETDETAFDPWHRQLRKTSILSGDQHLVNATNDSFKSREDFGESSEVSAEEKSKRKE